MYCTGKTISIKKLDIIKKYCVDGGRLGVIVYESTTGLYYSVLNGIESKKYKRLGNCVNHVQNEGFNFYTSENDIMKIKQSIHYKY